MSKAKVSNFSYRSGIETQWRCPRSGYLEQFYLGTGIVKKPVAYWLTVGSAVHLGLAEFLQISPIPFDLNAHTDDLAAACVQKALEYWDNSGQREVLHETTFNEQRILIEALLWAFYYNSLAQFLETYEILYVEQEVTEIVKGRPTYMMMSRPDAIVRDRTSGELVVISWKTIDDPNEWRRLFFKQDLQGMMEAYYSEQFIAAFKAKWTLNHPDGSTIRVENLPDKISYVQTIYLVKGKRAKLKTEGGYENGEEYAEGMFADTEGPQWRTDSHLIYPFTNVAETVKCGECKGKGKFEVKTKQCDACGVLCEKYRAGVVCPECETGVVRAAFVEISCKSCTGTGKTANSAFESLSWKYRYTKTGNLTPSALGPAYKRVLVTKTSMSVQEYVKALSQGEVFPSTTGNEPVGALQKTIVWENPSYRDAAFMESVVGQVKETERRRHRDKKTLARFIETRYAANERADMLNDDLFMSSIAQMLDKLFPQQLTSCNFPWRCQFADAVKGPCHSENGRAAIMKLRIPEGYQLREPHHEPEAEYRRSLVQIEGVKK